MEENNNNYNGYNGYNDYNVNIDNDDNNDNKGNKSDFFVSKTFKWILIIALELASLAIIIILSPKADELHNAKSYFPLIVYDLVCIVISVRSLFKLSGRMSRREQKNYTSQMFGVYTSPDTASERRTQHHAMMVTLSIILSPFLAPYSLGTLVHKIMCKAINN